MVVALLGVAGCAPDTTPATPESSVTSQLSSTSGTAVSKPPRTPQGNCPPACTQIPDAAWMDPAAIPLDDTYRWAPLAPLSEPVTEPRFLADELCAARPLRDEERDGALAAQVVLADQPGQWRLRVQILHWRGDSYVASQRMNIAMDAAAALLRNDCSSNAPKVSATQVVALDDYPIRSLTATITDTGPSARVAHVYLASDIRNSTIVEVALSSNSPPAVQWPSVDDDTLLAAMMAPLCTAYVDSCRG